MVVFPISSKSMQNPWILDCFFLPLAVRHHGLLAGSFRKVSHSLGFPLSLQKNFSSGSLRLFSPKSNIYSVHVLSSEGPGEGEGLPFYIYILEGRLLDAVSGWVDRCLPDAARR